jgi:hypothetical protein
MIKFTFQLEMEELSSKLQDDEQEIQGFAEK